MQNMEKYEISNLAIHKFKPAFYKTEIVYCEIW